MKLGGFSLSFVLTGLLLVVGEVVGAEVRFAGTAEEAVAVCSLVGGADLVVFVGIAGFEDFDFVGGGCMP